MKRFLIKIILLASLIFFAVLIINYRMLREKDDWSLYSHEKNVILAYNRLKALGDTNKIIIIAGSNGGFSINSRMISDTFQIPVVNTSTHAGLGVRMQFEMYKDFLKKGDIIIFCPEYESGKGGLYGSSALFRILSTHMPWAYRRISLPQWLFLYKYIGIHYTETLEHKTVKEFDGPYSAKALNEYGDVEYERNHKDSIGLYDLCGILDVDVVNYYKYLHTYAKENGIILIFLPPTFIASNFKTAYNQIDSIAKSLEQHGIAWQASPSNYSFPDSLYFDTPYHMTQSGANKRTEVLIKDLLRILADYKNKK